MQYVPPPLFSHLPPNPFTSLSFDTPLVILSMFSFLIFVSQIFQRVMEGAPNQQDATVLLFSHRRIASPLLSPQYPTFNALALPQPLLDQFVMVWRKKGRGKGDKERAGEQGRDEREREMEGERGTKVNQFIQETRVRLIMGAQLMHYAQWWHRLTILAHATLDSLVMEETAQVPRPPLFPSSPLPLTLPLTPVMYLLFLIF